MRKKTEAQRKKARSEAARKAALARWSKPQALERPLSQRARKQQLARIPTSQLTVEDYADRPNPELSWAAAILKRERSTEKQRKEAARIMSEYGSPKSGAKIKQYWEGLTPEQKSELAARGGRRRWEIWREEQAALHGQSAAGKPAPSSESES